ncbi:MAG TPA: DinB family protein [Longimicrobium sp.]|uniref:DinB family protein n=1 Tax=Longimicrobium sp. TaxID=2029185 RepID=UPI002ED91ADC
MTLPNESGVMTPAQLLEHWQGHRRLTRRVIEAFPEDQISTFSLGGMRPFAEMVMEMVSMAAPGVQGVASGDWTMRARTVPATRAEMLALWDEATEEINTLWPRIPAGTFQESRTAFGRYEGPVYQLFLYMIDNEIHHRGQGYAYLRALGVEPPPFWERG